MNAAPPRSPLTTSRRRLRVGVINLMPRAETYEPLVEAALGEDVSISWRRLTTHGYSSSDPARIARYEPLVEGLASLDALVLTGAPVEELPFTEVRYWSELSEGLARAEALGLPLLGLCWGGMVVASLLGVEKASRATKLFGVFEHQVAPELCGSLGGTHRCPESRHAGLDEVSLERAVRAGRAEVLATSEETGATILAGASPARGWRVAHLGHPEYDEHRLLAEWDRDSAAGRTDVAPPIGYDLAARRPHRGWSDDGARFFTWWKTTLRERVGAFEVLP
jgi:homoserine O-succinyltransferase/O-acetyltransferase